MRWCCDEVNRSNTSPASTSPGESARLDELRWAATERRVELQLLLGRHSEAIGDLSEWVQKMPLRERFHEQLALALYRSGRQADAFGPPPTLAGRSSRSSGSNRGGASRARTSCPPAGPTLDWAPLDGPADGIGGTGVIAEPAASACPAANGAKPASTTPATSTRSARPLAAALLARYRPAPSGTSRAAPSSTRGPTGCPAPI